MELLLVIH
jgi:hypothetical protein